eukprot:3803501-Amphidinium_carterae.1
MALFRAWSTSTNTSICGSVRVSLLPPCEGSVQAASGTSWVPLSFEVFLRLLRPLLLSSGSLLLETLPVPLNLASASVFGRLLSGAVV